MSVTSGRESALQQLAAARVRKAEPDELLDLADVAIEEAAAEGDSVALELIAAELDSSAAAYPESGEGLRVAAARARVAVPHSAAPPTVAPEPVQPAVAQATFYASWGSRFLAWLIDWCILFVAAVLIDYLLANGPASLTTMLAAFAYFTYFNGRGKTLGKLLLRIEVVDASRGTPIGPGRAALREITRLALTVFTLGIGLFVDGLRPLWNERHQSLHDSAGRSIVVHTGRSIIVR